MSFVLLIRMSGLDDSTHENDPSSSSSLLFTFIPRGATFLDDGNVASNLAKWDVFASGLRMTRYRYNKHYHRLDAETFARDFFADAHVQSTFAVLDEKNATWTPIAGRFSPASETDGVTAKAVPASLTSVDVLERLRGTPAVREDGYINKQIDAEYHGIVASDVLRDRMLNEESEVIDEVGWSDKDRDEFLVRLFTHLAIGGALNQYEDKVDSIVDTTRAMYKSLLSVRRGANDCVEITSGVFRVTGLKGDIPPPWLFPGGAEAHPQSFCYLITDPVRRHVVVLYHKHTARW